jgi:hypothetical protein
MAVRMPAFSVHGSGSGHEKGRALPGLVELAGDAPRRLCLTA